MTNATQPRKLLKDMTKEDLIQIALTEPGTISNCYSLFHNYSSNNAWLLAIQQKDRGLDITPVMSGSGWVKAGIITEETRKAIKSKLWAMVPQQYTIEKTDRVTGEKVLDEKGKPILISGTSFPFRQAFISYSMFKKSQLLKEFKPNYTVDFKATLERLELQEIKYGMTDGNCQGYCIPNQKIVAINPVAENAQKTMLHEIAHCLLHKSDVAIVDNKQLDRSIREAEAECTAYVCSIMLGDEDETHLSNSRAYIQSWLGRGNETLSQTNIKRICKAIDIIMKAIANNKGKYDKQALTKDLKELAEIKEGK